MDRRPRVLPCGCERWDLDEHDVSLSDEQIHDGMRHASIANLRYEAIQRAPRSAARALTWFYRHGDPLGIELLRALPSAELAQLVAGMRQQTDNPDRGIDADALQAAIAALDPHD